MKFLIVTVKPRSIEVRETMQPLKTIHARAVVDGDDWLYKIERHKGSKEHNARWFERGLNHLYYHARNEGNRVEFKHVNRKRPVTNQISDKQLGLFEGTN